MNKKLLKKVVIKLNALLIGNIDIIEAINILEKDLNEKEIFYMKKVKLELKKGNNLVNSFKKISTDTEFISYINMAEKSQNLKKILKILSDKYEKRETLKNEVLSIIMYPLLVITLSFILISVLLMFILPKFLSMYENISKLPYITRIAIGIKNNFILIIAIFFIFNFLTYLFLKKNNEYLLKIKIIKKIEILNLCENIYSFLEAEIPFVEGLKISKTSNNKEILKIIDGIIITIVKGYDISYAFNKSKFFDEDLISYLRIAEKTSNFKDIFFYLKEKYRNEVNDRIKWYLKLIEPLSILIISAIIGFFIMAIMIPIFNIGINIGSQ